MVELIPIVAIVMVFGIPIAAILTGHQRKMAELIHGKYQTQSDMGPLMHEIQSLRAEVQSLRNQVNEQAIVADDLRSFVQKTADVPARLDAGS